MYKYGKIQIRRNSTETFNSDRVARTCVLICLIDNTFCWYTVEFFCWTTIATVNITKIVPGKCGGKNLLFMADSIVASLF